MPHDMIDEYFDIYNQSIKQYGEKTCVLYACGSFYEVYKIENNTETIGNADIVSEIIRCDFSNKNKSKRSEEGSSRAFPDFCGFGTAYLPKYLPPAHGFDSYVGIPYPNDHGPERLGNTGSRGYPPIPLMRNSEKVKDLNNVELAEVPAQFIREACAFIKEKAASKQPFYLQYSNIETHTPYFIPKGFEGRSGYGAFGDAVAYIDYTVGVLTGYLKQLGLEKNTLIVVHSDNGPLVEKYPELEDSYGKFGLVDTSLQHVLRDGKYQQRFEGGVRSACFVKWPGVIGVGAVNQNIYSGLDLFTSFLQVAGAEMPAAIVIDGKPMIESIITNKPVRNTFYAFAPQKEVQGVRYNNWKLVIDKRGGKTSLLLFNLANDPSELNDLASKNKNIVQTMYNLAVSAEQAVVNNLPLQETNNFNF